MRAPTYSWPARSARRFGTSLLLLALLPLGASAGDATTCELRFAASDWSPQYRVARGLGTLECDDGRRMPVRVSVKGGDRALRIDSASASFSGVRDPRDVIGAYTASGDTNGPHRAMRKGNVQLRVTATGTWWQQGGRPDSLVIAAR